MTSKRLVAPLSKDALLIFPMLPSVCRQILSDGNYLCLLLQLIVFYSLLAVTCLDQIVGEMKRERWDSKSQFLLACVGYTVGLGNVWRFPYLCFKSGGGAFLIPYFLTLILCGIPLLYLEMAVGQYVRFGPVRALGILCPLMKGVGFATVVIGTVLCSYANTLNSWAIYYLFNSFRSVLPWQSCNHTWNSPACAEGLNMTGNFSGKVVSPQQDFFDQVVLAKTDGIHDMGGMQWEVFGCFVFTWVMIYICIFKGIKSAGKVVYFTATFPYFILILFLVTSVRLPGAVKGIKYFVQPEWNQLLKMEVWVNAAAQNFNSIGIGFGSLIAFSSYNPRTNNILRDTLCISCINSATSILAGFVIFSAMGHMSHTLGVPVNDVATQGPGLVFVVYPKIFDSLPVPPIWSALFFLMIITLGIDSLFSMTEVVCITLREATAHMNLGIFNRKEVISLAVCFFIFLTGIPEVMQGGIYVFTLLDNYTAIISLIFLAFFEILAICWLYGGVRLANNVREMTGQAPPRFFVFCWLIAAPLLIAIILICTIIQYKPARYGKYYYPAWADALGWMVALSSMLCIPIGAIIALVKAEGSFVQRLLATIQPQLERIREDDKQSSSIYSEGLYTVERDLLFCTEIKSDKF